MTLALLQLNPVVGDVDGNARRIADAARRAAAAGATCVITPELALTGYPPRDLLLRPAFIADAWRALEALARDLASGPALIVGVPEPNPHVEGRALFNSAVLLRGGRVEGRARKSLLPSYDVFDEDRYFEPAPDGPAVFDVDGQRLGITICEDAWNDRTAFALASTRRRYHHDPVEALAAAGVDAIVNLSASPFAVGKHARREQMLAAVARRHRRPLLYVNQVGGNDDLIFDGRSVAFSADGAVVARGASFEEDIVLVTPVQLDGSAAATAPEPPGDEALRDLWRALVLGTRDYARKCGFTDALLGLSGGIDSALTAAIAVEALGAAQVRGVLLPSPFSSQGSLDDAHAVAQALGMTTATLPITDAMRVMDQTLAPVFAEARSDVTEENIQARLRGTLLMALANKQGALLLTTGNKSEIAVGYCTLYGDMCGGLAVIADLPKTTVYALSRWLNAHAGRMVIPETVLTKAPSAELRPGQTDQDSLPPYDVLDAILARYLDANADAASLVADGFDASTVARVIALVHGAEFKRRQAAPGLRVTERAFGTGWRMPIAAARPHTQERSAPAAVHPEP